jgi:hypothetical protein
MAITSRQAASKPLQLALLLSVTLLLRILSVSSPYYVDGPRHVYAIESGRLVIKAPGYFLFNLCGWLVSRSLHVTAGTALELINISFSVAAVAVFYVLASRLLKNAAAPFWLTLAYACSPIVWFSADIHSTYAAMTFFAPLLLLVVESERRFVLSCFLWALMMGFRPSDGAFVLPWMLYQSLRFTPKQRIAGATTAAIVTALWWLPTAHQFGGGLFSPLSNSHTQAARLAQGILTGHLTIHALVNAVHSLFGIVLAWGLLTPALILGIFRSTKNSLARNMTIYIAPGLAFFFLYFFSDATYLAYAIAPGMVLAALYLEDKKPVLQQYIYAFATVVSLTFMVSARTSDSPSKTRAVVDAYLMQYSVPSIKQHKAHRLAELLGACHDETVQGVCR